MAVSIPAATAEPVAMLSLVAGGTLSDVVLAEGSEQEKTNHTINSDKFNGRMVFFFTIYEYYRPGRKYSAAAEQKKTLTVKIALDQLKPCLKNYCSCKKQEPACPHIFS